jgi:hypothetical protein
VKLKIIKIRREKREINGNFIIELVLQRLVAQQLTLTDPPPKF